MMVSAHGTRKHADDVIDFSALLFDVLRFSGGEYVSIGHDADGQFRCTTLPPAEAPRYVATLPDTANIFFGVNPVRQMSAGRRGTEADVTRLAALWADLDVKPDSCGSLDIAEAIIAELSIALDNRPSAITHSGHGLHPYWPISDGHITGTTRASAFLRRWGRLVAAVAERHHVTVDSVFDMPRMLRVPGTYNNKGMR